VIEPSSEIGEPNPAAKSLAQTRARDRTNLLAIYCQLVLRTQIGTIDQTDAAQMPVYMTETLDPTDYLLPQITSFGVTDGPFVQTCFIWDDFLGELGAPTGDSSLDAKFLQFGIIERRLVHQLRHHILQRGRQK
jgi:hypothetical protein